MEVTVEDAVGPTTVRWADPALGEWDVTFTWEWRGDRFEPRDLHLAPADPDSVQTISAVLLRKCPIGELVAEARARLFAAAGGHDAVHIAAADGGAAVAEEISAVAGSWRQRRAGRAPVHDDEHYREIAKVYSMAKESPGNPRPAPVQAIAEVKHVSLKTAERWAKEARKRGFLPPTTQGVPRGNPD